MVLFLTIIFGLLSIVYGVKTSQELLAADAGSQKMQEISDAIAEGAQAYLKRQYTTIAYVGGGIFVLLVILLGWGVAFGFLLGALLSGAAGFIGMNVSVRANVRTAQAATKSLAGGLDIAFKAGAITGLLVAGLALLGVAVYYAILTWFAGYTAADVTWTWNATPVPEPSAIVLFGMGMASIAVVLRSRGRKDPV